MTQKRKPAAKPRTKAGTSKEAAEARKTIFVEALIANGGNVTEAAKTAGYSPKTAGSQGQRLLKDVTVKTALAARRENLAEKFELTTDSVIAELSKIVHADPRRLFREDGTLLDPKDWPDGVAGAVASIEVVEMAGGAEVSGDGAVKHVAMYTKRVKLWDKNSAIDKAMKHLGLFEADNKQKAGALSELPREMVKAIVDRLKQLNANGKSARLD